MKNFNYSKYAKMSWNNEIIGYISQIHEFRGKQEHFTIKNPVKLKKLIEIAKIQSTEASNKIEGIVTTNIRIRQICENKTTPKTRDEKEILGYMDVLNTIHESHEYIPIKPAYILQLHKDLYKYSEKAIGGKFKNVQNYITETREDGSTFVRFLPLEPFETLDAVDRLCEEFNIFASKSEVDVLILIPIFILDFLCIHPFNDGNGRMSRLLTLLLLYKFGYDVGKYVSIEKVIEETKNNYYDTLQESSVGWINGNNNPTAFIKYMLGIILKAYRDFEERVQVVTESKLSAKEQLENVIVSFYGKFYKKDLVEKCPNLSETTIERVLKQLVDSKEIIKKGERKSTYYLKNDK